jgi:MmoB/DmpM family
MVTSGSKSPNTGDDLAAVGPVLTPGPLADAIIAAIRAAHEDVRVVDRGAYLRVLVPERCRLEGARVEKILEAPFRLPGDLEAIMPSFRGRLTIASDGAVWERAGGPWS